MAILVTQIMDARNLWTLFIINCLGAENTLTPKGCVEVRKGSQIAPKGVADLLLEGLRKLVSEATESPVFGTAENAPK
jgi:hypothetical protein